MEHRQLDHQEVVVENQRNKAVHEIILFLDALRTPSNIAGIFRLSECFGVNKIMIHGDSELLISKSFRSIARIHEKHLDIEHIDSGEINAKIEILKSNNFKIAALEYTSDSISLSTFKMNDNMVLILGNERHGIRDTLLKQCDYSLHIPMYGNISSLNVQQACSIALYKLRQ